ncbi:MAG TPA: preprotein translocase subunit SecG [Clostridia bacterium]
MFQLLQLVPRWVEVSFPYIRMGLMVMEVLLSIFLIIVVLFQPGNSDELGAISGGQDTFFGKNKGKTLEGRMKKMTITTAILLVVNAAIYFVTLTIYNGQI